MVWKVSVSGVWGFGSGLGLGLCPYACAPSGPTQATRTQPLFHGFRGIADTTVVLPPGIEVLQRWL